MATEDTWEMYTKAEAAALEAAKASLESASDQTLTALAADPDGTFGIVADAASRLLHGEPSPPASRRFGYHLPENCPCGDSHNYPA